jgi:hypothetical protein
MTNAISKLVESLFNVLRGIVGAILSVFQGAYDLIVGVVTSLLHLFEGVISFFWSESIWHWLSCCLPGRTDPVRRPLAGNFTVLLLIGLALCAYQIFIVDAGQRNRRTGVQKKLS